MGCAPNEKNTHTVPEPISEITEVVKVSDTPEVDLIGIADDDESQEEIVEETKVQSAVVQKAVQSKKEEVAAMDLNKDTEIISSKEVPGQVVSSIDACANDTKEANAPSSPKEEIVENAAIDNSVVSEEVKAADSAIESPKEEMEAPIVGIHDSWNAILQDYVSNAGFVDYTGLKKAESKLDGYLQTLSANTPKKSDKSIKAKVFWINAYNAFTVKLILNNMPVQSIRDISKGEPWSVSWIELGSEVYSLNNIEHDILRPTWGDARIHFAVNCAAKSCPPISNEAFTESNQDQKLEDLSKSFINNSKFNSVSSSKLVLSKIFEWYKSDFGELSAFIDKYTTVDIGSNPSISYQDYDWSLNGK